MNNREYEYKETLEKDSMLHRYKLLIIALFGVSSVYQVNAADDIDEEEPQDILTEESEEFLEHQLFDFHDIVTLGQGTRVIFGTGLFRSTSGLVNYTDNVKLRANSTLTLRAGDGINTGVLHNYGRVEL